MSLYGHGGGTDAHNSRKGRRMQPVRLAEEGHLSTTNEKGERLHSHFNHRVEVSQELVGGLRGVGARSKLAKGS